ncbi:MAG TPA: efflux RND transporter periplasmic adaptor subunit [Candidatus Sulfopaludibacter sp.]|nr:efflux RND transporter periplasmic adaptor subunit [Candidatus Sulfopaludibacter sp.]
MRFYPIWNFTNGQSSSLTLVAKNGLIQSDIFMSSPQSPLDQLRIERRPDQPSRFNPWVAGGAAGFLLVLGALLWWHSRSDAIEVQTVVARDANAGAGDQRTVLNASGYVTARREATVSSKVTGKVMEVLIEEGMKVTNGQVVARLDDSNVKTSLDVAVAQLASAKAALAETEAQLKDADQEYQRTIELAKQHIASQSDLDLAESNAKALQAHLAQQKLDVVVAERQVELWQQQMDDMIIRAPFDGVITTKDAQPGEMISPVSAGGGFTRTGIGTIVDMTSLEIEIDVNESYINRVESGQPVEATLDAYPDWKIPCKVIAIIPTADRDKSTVKVRVGFDRLDPRILPDMSVKVAFRDNGGTGSGHAVMIPKGAVLSRDGRDVVFVVRDGHAERRAVTVSDTQGDDSVLSAGVAAGEKVVVSAPANLQDGMAVKEKTL